MKILVIRFSSIGDIVLTTPVVRCIKKQLPETELHYVTKAAFEDVLKHNPYIDKLWLLKDNFAALAKQLHQEHFDYVVDLHGTLRSWRLRLALHRPAATFPKLNLRKALLVHFKLNFMPKVHIVDRYFCAARKLKVKNDGQGLDFFLPNSPQSPANTIAVVLGGKHATKQMPVNKLVEVLSRLQNRLPEYNFLLLGGKEDRPLGERIHERLGHTQRVQNTCGECSIAGSASLLATASVVITGDTGMMHISAALNRPIVSVWGNTVPDLGMYPYMPLHPERFCIVEAQDVSCRPCSKLGYPQCPKGHFKCMNSIATDRIVEATLQLLSQNENAAN